MILMANIIDIYGDRYRLKRKYLKYLMERVEVPSMYAGLCETLLMVEFEPVIGNDSDRCVDGLDIRREFEGGDYSTELSDESPCSVLEMLVALAERTANLMYEGGEGESPGHYFWVFMRNLGLDKMKDTGDFRKKQRLIVEILEQFMDPECSDVEIVSIKHPPKRWTNLEIWKKVNWFLTENYYEG